MSLTLIVNLALMTAHFGLANAQQNNTLMQSQGKHGMTTNVTNVNIVLVHGTWVDGSSWSKVIPILQNAGHKVIAAQLSLHSLSDDIATVKRAVGLIGGAVILVGHSYGGFVITNTAYNNPSVKGLVYLAAFAPNEGQSLSNFVDATKFPKGFLVFDSGGFIYINLRYSPKHLLKTLIRPKQKLWQPHKSQQISLCLLKNLARQLGNNYLLGTKSLRTTVLYLQMLSVCLQNK
jgi:pimeloyl-ACP methyl ester carboxylesterase